jgi:magnesium-transporting ATPase (P-type)
VTGINYYKKKGVLTLENVKKNQNDYSNVLYNKSYIVDGFGKAVVCAVGKRSQYSMTHAEI